MIVFRHADPRFPFLWEAADQPPGRWHRAGKGPTHYLADTPDGAWAEFLRHEEIKDRDELPGIHRALWSVEIGDAPAVRPELARETMTGGRDTYPACQDAAERLRADGVRGLVAPSAALKRGGASGWRVENGMRTGPPRDGTVIVLFGRHPDIVGWQVVEEGRPLARLLGNVRHFGG